MRVLKGKHFQAMRGEPNRWTDKAIKFVLPGSRVDYIIDQGTICYYDRQSGCWFRAFIDLAETEQK